MTATVIGSIKQMQHTKVMEQVGVEMVWRDIHLHLYSRTYVLAIPFSHNRFISPGSARDRVKILSRAYTDMKEHGFMAIAHTVEHAVPAWL